MHWYCHNPRGFVVMTTESLHTLIMERVEIVDIRPFKCKIDLCRARLRWAKQCCYSICSVYVRAFDC